MQGIVGTVSSSRNCIQFQELYPLNAHVCCLTPALLLARCAVSAQGNLSGWRVRNIDGGTQGQAARDAGHYQDNSLRREARLSATDLLVVWKM